MRITRKIGLAFACGGALFISACSASETASQAPGAEATAAANLPQGPTPEYAQKDGDTYMYVGAVTDEEKKQGEIAPVVSFRNLGLRGEVQRLERVGDNGVGIGTFECSAPCRVAKRTDLYGNITRQAVEPTTILAAAFRDAANGLMEVVKDRNVIGRENVSQPNVSVQNPSLSQLPTSASGFRQPDFAGRDRRYSMYRTRILEGLRDEGANFAGHYTIIRIGCGTGCTFNFVADRATGEVSDLPYGGEEQQMLTLRHSVASNTLNASWLADGLCMVQQARWTGTTFAISGEPMSSPDSSCSS